MNMWVKKIIKVGDSLAVTIPYPLCEALKIVRGDFVFVFLLQDDKIILQKIDEKDASRPLEDGIQTTH